MIPGAQPAAPPSPAAEPPALAALRRILLGILMLGLLGLGAELLLLGHYESPAQAAAPALIALAMLAGAWHGVSGGASSVRLFRLVMLLLLAAAPLGLYFHYAANVAFQREMDPGAHGMALVRKALAAKAPPALAPGAMAQLGLIGLACTFQPARTRTSNIKERR